MVKILVFAASASEKSINLQLAKYAATFLKGFEVSVVDFAKYNTHQVYVEDAEKGEIPETVKEFRQILDAHDGYLISMSENNFGPTAAWKNMLDWISRYVPANGGWKNTFGGKPTLILGTSPSPMGASNAVENAAKYYPYLGAKVVGSFSFVSFYKNFKDQKIVEAEQDKQLQEAIAKLIQAFA